LVGRGELNPRPQVLRHKVYMLISLFNLANDYTHFTQTNSRQSVVYLCEIRSAFGFQVVGANKRFYLLKID